MGFCLFNNVAVAVAHALEAFGLSRVAIADFDVHHGNGTEDIFRNDPRVMVCSSFQHPFYPYLGGEGGNDHIINVPLPANTSGDAFREAIEIYWKPALESFRPEMLFISAGFDAHWEDDQGQMLLNERDYRWISQFLKGVAAQHCNHRLVSVLEGGYVPEALGRSVATHMKVLMS
jgi:acetoin utilization deacetylase AcuC-like enzyme